MQTMIHAARTRAHLSRRERQRIARVHAFSRRTPSTLPGVPVVVLEESERGLIARLVRHDRTAVSSALLALAGIGAGPARRQAVLIGLADTARAAEAEGAIGAPRAAQIARHLQRARAEVEVMADGAGEERR